MKHLQGATVKSADFPEFTKEYCEAQYELAEKIARREHASQQYLGQPYFHGHVKEVEKVAINFLGNHLTPIQRKMICTLVILHDVPEDGSCQKEDLVAEGLDQWFIDKSFELDATQYRTRDQYIQMMFSHVALYVTKFSDVTVNLSNSLARQEFGRIRKYSTDLHILTRDTTKPGALCLQ